MGNKSSCFGKLPADRRFAEDQLALVFDHYAAKSSTLSKEDLGVVIKHLCSDFKGELPEISKVLAVAFQSDMRARSGERNAKYWESVLVKPLENLIKRLPQVTEDVYQMVDENKDGKVDKSEFVKHFIPTVSRYFKPSVFKLYATGISLAHVPGYQGQATSFFAGLGPPSATPSPSASPSPSSAASPVSTPSAVSSKSS